jgi:hypothetical protein
MPLLVFIRKAIYNLQFIAWNIGIALPSEIGSLP